MEGKREGGGGRHVSGEERRRELEEKRGCFGSNPRKLDGDTLLSEASYDAACRGTGAVLHAVDRVVRGEARNAFVAIRPPGHHAGPDGAVASCGFHRRPDMCSSGFCLLNHVAIAAA